MKFKKLFVIASLFMAALVVFAGGVTASASKKKSKITYLSSFPRSMRGTWYSYDTFDHTINTTKITAHAYYFNHYKNPLHKYVKHNPDKFTKKQVKKTMNWIYLSKMNKKIHGHKWIYRYGWAETAGAGEDYTVSSYKGHKVLTEAGGADVHVDSHDFKTKQLAKKYKHAKLPKFKYQEVD